MRDLSQMTNGELIAKCVSWKILASFRYHEIERLKEELAVARGEATTISSAPDPLTTIREVLTVVVDVLNREPAIRADLTYLAQRLESLPTD